jgi:lactoylglutathione lyase
MERVTGIGGIFFKSDDPEKLYGWYAEHLGIKRDASQAPPMFEWRDARDPQKQGLTVWALFPKDTKYFGSSHSGFMINYRVDNLDAVLEALRAERVEIDPHREDYDYGKLRLDHRSGRQRIELEPLTPPSASK